MIIQKRRNQQYMQQHILDDRRTKGDRPIIFAVTHVGKFDIEVVSESVH